MKSSFLKSFFDENMVRRSELKKNINRENIFAQMNDALMQNHDSLMLERKDIPNYPAIFLFGLPRSGTTLLMQLFTLRFDVGYINNLIARFWRSPLYGIALSKELLGDKKYSIFESNYGKTFELAEPHEFAYFWHYWFNIENLYGIDLDVIKSSTDWNSLTHLILNMAYQFGKPIALKGMWPAFALSKLQATLPQSFFIYIKRSPEDVALSLYHARISYYSDPNYWLSMCPPEFEKLVKMEWPKQIAGQVYYLTKYYEQQLEQVPEKYQAQLSYEELCESPHIVMDRLNEKVYQHTGYRMKISHNIPGGFTVRHPDSNFEGAEELLAKVRDYFGKKESV